MKWKKHMVSRFRISKSKLRYALPQHRGKWASLGSLNRATFAGSAVLGGYISDAYGYRLGFAVTGCFCMCGVLVYSPMWCLVRHP